jgi:aspartate/methionine/tyrosine aminotransferase
MDSTTFAERALRENDVAITPGSAFGRSCDNYIRISYATSMENLTVGCQRIKDFVQKVRG